jgi:DNA-binding protein HU-beta
MRPSKGDRTARERALAPKGGEQATALRRNFQEIPVKGGAFIFNEEESEMTKAELVSKIAGEGGITKSQAEKAVDGFVAAVSAALAAGDKVTLVGFGTFSVGSRSQREGRNPRTGAKIKIPASKVVKFKAGKTLSEKVK